MSELRLNQFFEPPFHEDINLSQSSAKNRNWLAKELVDELDNHYPQAHDIDEDNGLVSKESLKNRCK